MTENGMTYLAIDLKSFFASVECVERGLNPLTTNLVVADASRTEKTICLAVSPSLKAYGLPGRARLFEVVQRVRQINIERAKAAGRKVTGKSFHSFELENHPDWVLDYITAPPRMAKYIEYSAKVYSIYLKYIAPEDIHAYSIDEVFIDATPYLKNCASDAHTLAMTIIRDVLQQTGITATAGIGTNLYLAKVAMDIVAKHIPADKDGVRIAELDEHSYRRKLWNHRPLTDFWRVGKGIAGRLEACGIRTMGDLARTSLRHEEVLYRMFGVNAELLIDHAWGHEPCTIAAIKAYRPETNSFSNGQVLQCPYTAQKARIVAMEMAEAMALRLLDKGLVASQVSLWIGYDRNCLDTFEKRLRYEGPVCQDRYGRPVPKPVNGGIRLETHTSSMGIITEAVTTIFDRLVNTSLMIRRLNVTAGGVISEQEAQRRKSMQHEQLELFTDYDELRQRKEAMQATLNKERRMQEAALNIKKTFGKNALLRGLNFAEGATAKERNSQTGGHKA